ncbi:MAG TPA: site-specific integrase [Candidatus Limnocylindrales bacterium]
MYATTEPIAWPSAAAPLADLGEAIDRQMAAEGLAPRQREQTAVRIGVFGRYVAARLGRPPIVRDLNGPMITAWISAPGASGQLLSESSKLSYGSDLRAVLNRAIDAGVLPAEAAAGLDLPRPPRLGAPDTFSTDELISIFDAFEAEPSHESYRLRFFVQVMLDSGPRPDEVVGIRGVDLDPRNGRIRLDGKGRKPRWVPAAPATWRMLDEYLRFRGPIDHPDDALFLGRNGGLTASTIQHEFLDLLRALCLRTDTMTGSGGVKRRIDRLGVPAEEVRNPSLYTLRRTFAQRFADAGRPVEELAAIMGHSPASIPMLLRVYYRPSFVRLRRAHAEAGPAERFHAERATRGRVRDLRLRASEPARATRRPGFRVVT